MPGLNRPSATSGDQLQISLGEMVRQVHTALYRAQQGVEFFQSNTNADLLRDFGIPTPDAQALREAFNELADLWTIYRGERIQPTARDFHGKAAKVYGLGFH